MTTTEKQAWLAERMKGIGSSDAPAALGVCPYKSRFQLWAEKTASCPEPNLDMFERVWWGKALEPVIIQRYREKTGREVKHNKDNAIHRHKRHFFMQATLDATQNFITKTGYGILEIKCTEKWDREAWETEPPIHCQVQVQHQLAVTGLAWGTIAVLIRGNRLVWFDIDRNDKFIAAMIEKEAFFWTGVLDKIPPNPDDSIATTDTLRRLYPRENGETKALPSDASDWDSLVTAAKKSKKTMEGVIRGNENKIKAAMGNATVGVLPGGGRYTFRDQDRKGYTVEPTSFRVLRREEK